MRIKCRICRGERDVYAGVCVGCNTPAENAVDRSKARPTTPRCPRCGPSGRAVALDSERWECRACGAVFEKLEFTFADDRPGPNAEKREAYRGKVRR